MSGSCEGANEMWGNSNWLAVGDGCVFVAVWAAEDPCSDYLRSLHREQTGRSLTSPTLLSLFRHKLLHGARGLKLWKTRV
jgi:hypothetical protein